MSRKSRVISRTGIYHVILRSINQQQIFEEAFDYQKFLFVLADVKKEYSFKLYAYCLMGNHIHLLMETEQYPLGTIFRSIGSRFANWYNKKYERFGHLFQDRFLSFPVETRQYFLCVLQYIHENPVKAKICMYPTEYQWSSCKAYYGERNLLITKDFAIQITGSITNLHQFFHTHPYDNSINDICNTIYFSDEKALQIIASIANTTNPSTIQKLPRVQRNYLIEKLYAKGLHVAQIARLCGISRGTVYSVIRKRGEHGDGASVQSFSNKLDL